MHWSEYHAECVCTHCTHRTELQKEIRWMLTMIPRDGQQCPRARGHMLRIFMTLPSLYRSSYTAPRSTILPSCNTQASNGNVATIVLLASRRGIISAHCHRLIEFGIDRIAHVDRPTVAMNAMHVQCRHKQKGTGFSILSVVAPSMRSSKGARFECLYC